MSTADTEKAPGAGDGEFLVLEDQKISDQDRDEILQEIDKVVAKNKLDVRPSLFNVKPTKNGIIFPLVINIAAVAAVVAGFVGAGLYFSRQQTEISSNSGTFFSAEGKLIDEVRKQSEAQLQAKQQQIQDIQQQLGKLDQEATSLRQNMDSTIAAKEKDLQAQLATQLDAEKARLQKLGISQEEIDRRMKAYQDQTSQQFAAQLSDYQKQSQAALAAKETEIQSQREQQNQILAQANTERQNLVNQAQAQEAQMRADFETQQAQLQSQNKQLQSAATQAQQQLTALSTQTQNEQLVADQIVASYNTIVQDIQANKLDQAQTDMASLRSLLQNPRMDALPDIVKRRPVDLGLLSSLSDLVKAKSQASLGSSTTAVDPAVAQAASQLAAGQALVAKADAARSQGDLKGAQDLYAQSLAQIPALNRAFAALSGFQADSTKQLLAARDAIVQNLQADSAAKAKEADQLSQSLKQAQANVVSLQEQLSTESGQLSASSASENDLKSQLAQAQTRLSDLGSQLSAAQARPTVDKGYGPDDLATAQQKAREAALSQILLVTDYYGGRSQTPENAQKIGEIANEDPLFKNAASSIQALAENGSSAPPVVKTQYKLIGTVSFVDGGTLTVERFVNVAVAKGSSVVIKHRDASGVEVPVATGQVSNVSADRVVITVGSILASGAVPQTLDLAYLELSA